jgi:hypothetical protein
MPTLFTPARLKPLPTTQSMKMPHSHHLLATSASSLKLDVVALKPVHKLPPTDPRGEERKWGFKKLASITTVNMSLLPLTAFSLDSA